MHVLTHVPYFAGLTTDEVADVNALMQVRWHDEDDSIYQAGQDGSELHVLASGRAKVFRPSASGHDVVVDLVGPGDSFGTLRSLGSGRYTDTAQSLTRSCVLTLSNADFHRVLARHPQVALAVVEDLAARLEQSHRVIRQLSADTVEQRVAAALLSLVGKHGSTAGDGSVRVSVSRADLAAMTGTTIESASRVVSRLRSHGVIATGRGWTSIIDPERLGTVAEGTQL